jgi:hypothetical protein
MEAVEKKLAVSFLSYSKVKPFKFGEHLEPQMLLPRFYLRMPLRTGSQTSM